MESEKITFDTFIEKAKEIRKACYDSVYNILKTAINENRLRLDEALPIMNKFIDLLNKRMSLPNHSPNASSLADASKCLTIKEQSKISIIYNRKAWMKLSPSARQAELSKDWDEKDKTGNRIKEAINGSMLTFGQAVTFLLGQVPIVVNADKHLNAKGEFKKEQRITEGMRRKFAFVDYKDYEDVFLCIAYKTYISFLNSVIGQDGKLNIPKVGTQNDVQWSVKDGNKGFKKISILDGVLKELIANRSIIYKKQAASITTLVYSKSSSYITFGCYQVKKEKTEFIEEVAYLDPEEKANYINYNEN
jgi:hypothetical protein